MGLAYLAAAAIALGHALQISNGFYTPAALAWLAVAIACAAFGVAGRRSVHERGTLLTLILLGGVLWQLSTLARAKPGLHLDTRDLESFHRWALLAAGIVVSGMLPVRWLRAAWFPALVAVHLGLGLWMIEWSPAPEIDVVTVHNAALRRIVHARNPYAITFANIYGPDSAFYAPGAESGGRVLFGYPYPPLSLLLVVPGYLLGDYRYAQLAALALAAIAMAYARPSLNARLAAALFLTTPRVFFVVEQGWSEPVSVLLLALTVFVMLRSDRSPNWRDSAAIVAGLACASKQYLVLILPPLWKWASAQTERRRFVIVALTSAAVLPLLFLVWWPRPFIDSVVLLQLREPFRADSLSFLGWLSRSGWGAPSAVWTIAALIAAMAVVLPRTERSPAGVAISLALVLMATFAFGRKAFCNYYFFVIGALCCGIAAAEAEPAIMANKRRTHDEPAVRPGP